MSPSKFTSFLAASLSVLSTLAFSQAWTTPYTSPTAMGDCAGLSANLNNEFVVEPVISDSLFKEVAPYRVLKMAFHLQPGSQDADIYIAEKGSSSSADGKARVLYYNGVTKSLKVIGTVPHAAYGSPTSSEHGLLGLALHSKTFDQHPFLYLYYSFGSSILGSENVGLRITRVTLNPTTREIDFNSEKVLLHIPTSTMDWFAGGGVAFDHAGNLYVSVGDNESLFMGPANTTDLRGSILRIKPDTTQAKGYAIPSGNFGEYWARQFDSLGQPGLAAKYRDTSKVKGEIYIKGLANVFSFSVDPTRPGWVQWSQCGPDVHRGETHNLTTRPAFGGWPFWVFSEGNAVRQASKPSAYDGLGEPNATHWATVNPSSMSPSLPVNAWAGNPGVDTLPPTHLPFFSYANPRSAAGGPIIRYDGRAMHSGRMPPHLDQTVMIADFSINSGTHSIWAAKVNDSGAVIGAPVPVFTMARASRPNLYTSVDFQQGPDGLLYMVDWGDGGFNYNPPRARNGISRIRYTGTCQDAGLQPTAMKSQPFSSQRSSRLQVNAHHITVLAASRHTLRIMTLQGRVLHTFAGAGSQIYAMPALPLGQLYILRLETNGGVTQQFLSLKQHAP